MEEKKRAATGVKRVAANLLHIVIIAVLLLYTLYAVVADGGVTARNFWGGILDCLRLAGINQIFTFIGAVAFILFGIAGMYEYAYTNGLRMLLPPFYLECRKKHNEETAKIMMKTYYEQDIDFIQQYEQERMNRVLQALGIAETQFHHIQYELVRARIMPQDTQEEMRAKLELMVYRREFIIDQSRTPLKKRVYRHVDYFINLYTALYDSNICTDVGNIMAGYILSCLTQSKLHLADIDYIMVPFGGNLLLGLEVGRCLQKPIIAVQEKPRILKDRSWDGNYRRKDSGKNHIIIVHDVLVSGTRIYQSAEKLPSNTYVIDGLYCLIQYDHSHYRPETVLNKHGICSINCLMHTNEDILKEARKRPTTSEGTID